MKLIKIKEEEKKLLKVNQVKVNQVKANQVIVNQAIVMFQYKLYIEHQLSLKVVEEDQRK